MQEAVVQKAIIDYLHQQGAVFFVDPGNDPSYNVVRERCVEVSNCEINDSIRIGSKIPDVVGLNNQGEIFAIEAKGDTGLRKGIGQATDYRRGVNKSYLAAEATQISRYEDSAQAAGLGTIPVDSSGVVADRIAEPNPNIAGSEISSVRRALALKTTDFESGRLIIPPMYRPENALLPVLVIKLADSTREINVVECKQRIRNSSANYSDFPDNPIRLARTLQLIGQDAQRNLYLTDHGETAYAIIKGIHAIEGGEGEVDVSTVDDYRDRPQLVAFLRDRYFATPPIRLLVKILAAQEGSRMEVSEILAAISRESPDVFQSLFCNDNEAFRELILDNNISDEEFRQCLLKLTKITSLYNFTNQLQVIGILGENSDKTDTSDELEVGKLFWEWDPEPIGRIGAL